MNTVSQVNIYNMALAAIGVSKSVQSLTEGSLSANTCNLFWEPARDQVLEDFPWGFAMRFAALQLISKTIPGWQFTYAYPADCIKARLVMPTMPTTTDVVPGYLSAPVQFRGLERSHKRIPFQIIENEASGGLGIATNLPTAILAYTARIITIGLWSPSFVNALTWLLASKIVSPLASNPKFAETAGQAYEAALLKAGANSLSEGVEKQEPESELVREHY